MLNIADKTGVDREAASAAARWTVADLEPFPEEGYRYEIIDGELYVSKQPSWHHQVTCNNIQFELSAWSRTTGLGIVIPAPGIIYAEDEAVVPDIVWISRERMQTLLEPDSRHLRQSPELVIEGVSPGAANERRDRDIKLRLYARRGVQAYWLADWRSTSLEIYQRHRTELQHTHTLHAGEMVTSSLLPGFGCPVERFFEI